MPRTKSNKRPGKDVPCVLTIAGSDSGGGAGIQADLKTFAALGVHGATAITCLTAQNPVEVRAIQSVPPAIVRSQIEAVFDELPSAAVKTGMLFSTEIIETVAACLEKRAVPLVIDPVMVATSGALLLKPAAVRSLLNTIFPLATLVTPNLHEAQKILNRTIRDSAEGASAARELYERFGCAVLVKGGHLTGVRQALDFFYDGDVDLRIEAPFIRNVSTHGTGCTLSAAIAAWLALGKPLRDAVLEAKEFVWKSISNSYRCEGHDVLNPLANRTS